MPKTERELNTRDAKRDIGAELLASVREMKAEARGRTHQPVVSEVARARLASGLSQPAFAALLGVSVRTLQDWEQGRRKPSGAAKLCSRSPSSIPKFSKNSPRSAYPSLQHRPARKRRARWLTQKPAWTDPHRLRGFYKASAAKSASRERSPRTRITCPP